MRTATIRWPLLAALLSFVAWQPFVLPAFDLWQADDGEYHLLRVYVFEAAIRGGEWLPRWTPDLFIGYGYPIFNFYAPGTYYAALVLRTLGLDVYTTVQALGAIGTCLGAAGAYCLARTVLGGRLPGIVSALAYTYAPYPFITNLVVRADLAEVLGLALLPWTLLAAWRAGAQPSRGSSAWLTLALGSLILTHNLTALVALPAAAAVGLFAATRRGGLSARSWSAGAAAALAGLGLALGLTAFFWMPALIEQRDVQIEVALLGSHKSPRAWLIDPLGATEQTRAAGNPQTVNGPIDQHLPYPYNLNYPPKPSLAQGVLAVVSLASIVAGAMARRRGTPEALFFVAGVVVLWFLTTTWSAWAWEHIPLMRFLQFSWRLYGLLALALGMAGAGAAAVWAGASGPRAATKDDTWTTSLRSLVRQPRVYLAAAPLAITVLLAANTTTARPLRLGDPPQRRAGGTQLVATENTLFGAGTTTGGEFVPRAADLEALGPGKRRGNGIYERLYPEFGWIAGRARVLDGQLAITNLASGVTWTDVAVTAETSGRIAFRTIDFPGWRAYLDGRLVQAQMAPRDMLLGVSPGFIVVEVPASEHRVQIAFGSTPVRAAAGAASVVTLAWLGWWLSGRWRRGALAPALALLPAALLAAACAHDTIRPQVGPPVQPKPRDQRLAADLITLVAQGRAAIGSPSGSALGPFVDLRRLAIRDTERRWLYMHPPSSVSFSLRLPERAAFQAGLALDPRTWESEGADGVRFIVEVAPGGVPAQSVFDEAVNPRARDEDRGWLDRWIDLSAFGGQQVTLTLRTHPAQTAEYDWAGWADPVIVTQRDARRPGGGPPGPLPTPRSS